MEFQNRLYELLELGEYDIPTFRERMEAVKGKIAVNLVCGDGDPPHHRPRQNG